MHLHSDLKSSAFRVLRVDATTRKSEVLFFGSKSELVGGSGLAAALYEEYGLVHEPAYHPDQPLIFAIGTLTGYYPLMSKVVCGFKSPYHDQYAESHAGGRLAVSMRFAGYDAIVITGRSERPIAIGVGAKDVEIKDVHYAWGMEVFDAGKLLRRLFPGSSGHRSTLRIGPAAENQLAYGLINVDTYRHFGRLGSGSIMGAKLIKGIVVQGDSHFPAPEGKAYDKLYTELYKSLTSSGMMKKYHDLGTPENLVPLNELQMLPWNNLQATTDPRIDRVSGETFAKDLLLRNAACSGCPVGCIHIGMLREQYAKEHHFIFRKVAYDYEPIFSLGTMLGIDDAGQILAILEEVERMGMDCLSSGVALAWATEALEKGIITQDQTIEPLTFGDPEPYKKAVHHLGKVANGFYALLGQGTMKAAQEFGGEDFACVLGQEMAGYATGETFFVSQALGFRHSHLDSGGYSYDQKEQDPDVDKAVNFMVDDERDRCLLTSTVACLFSRKAYNDEMLGRCFEALGYNTIAADMDAIAGNIQKSRWKLKLATGFNPHDVTIPKRYTEVKTFKGHVDADYLEQLRSAYASRIIQLGR